jgi:intracellular septation protein A
MDFKSRQVQICLRVILVCFPSQTVISSNEKLIQIHVFIIYSLFLSIKPGKTTHNLEAPTIKAGETTDIIHYNCQNKYKRCAHILLSKK